MDLHAMLAGLAQRMANAALRLDAASAGRLAALEGRTVQVESTRPGQVWSVRVRDARIEVLAGLADAPDVVVRGEPQDLLAWFAAPGGRAAERVEIDGDATVLADLAALFKALSPSGLAPPIRGQDLLGAAELAAAVLRSAAQGAGSAWRDANVERFVNRTRFSGFLDGIDNLRLAVERLSVRVGALESARAGQLQRDADAGAPSAAEAAGAQHHTAADSGKRREPPQ